MCKCKRFDDAISIYLSVAPSLSSPPTPYLIGMHREKLHSTKWSVGGCNVHLIDSVLVHKKGCLCVGMHGSEVKLRFLFKVRLALML